MEFSHKSVLLMPAVDGLNVREGGIYADCTAGGGGHGAEIAARLKGSGRLFCFDQDGEAIEAAKKRLAGFNNITFIKRNFRDIREALREHGVDHLDGALMDLGVSSHQLDDPERGFSFHNDAPLDMRMSGEGMSAYDVVNEYPEEKLAEILFSYGEEKFARGIAHGIAAARENAPIATTGGLAEIIKRNVPLKVRKEKNPCRKTFQAIRIEVNGELDALKTALDDVFELLSPGGRFAVITFHSLEDRIVKQSFAERLQGCVCPKELPVCVCGRKPQAVKITGKPITADSAELADNPRSRSAKLRIIEKTGTVRL